MAAKSPKKKTDTKVVTMKVLPELVFDAREGKPYVRPSRTVVETLPIEVRTTTKKRK